MKSRFPLLASAALSFLFLASAQAVTVELFHESFDGNDQNWQYTSTGARSYDRTWTESDTVKPGYKGVKLGSTNADGSITSESFAISNASTDVTITIVAAAYSYTGTSKEGIAITVFDSSNNSIFTDSVAELTKHTSTAKDEIPATSDYTHTFTIPASSLPAQGGIHLKIESIYTSSGQRRALIGDVRVTQSISSGLQPLDPPSPLSTSDVGYFGFTLSWTGVSGATGYEVTVTNANGATVFTGSYLPLETTAIITGLSEGATYTASVVAKGDGTTSDDSSATELDVTTLIAPAVTAPVLTESNVSPSSFTVSWPAQNDATFSVRAWTLVPADVATETFAGYPAIEPLGWEFNGTETNNTQSSNSYPVAFKKTASIVSPVYPADIGSVTFDLTHGNATSSSFSVYGSSDNGETWTTLVEYSNAGTHISNGERTISVNVQGIRKLKFEFTKSSGNLYLGPVSVTGTGVGKQRSYLPGYGPAPTAVQGNGTSVTISNPVAGETNYVEATATGLTGRTATSDPLPVPVPRATSIVISVK